MSGGTYVSVIGTFPARAHVWFGDLPGTTFAQTDTWIVVRTPATDQAGVVDVTVRTNADGVVLTADGSFAYVADDTGSVPGDNPSTPTDPGSGDPGDEPTNEEPTTPPDQGDPGNGGGSDDPEEGGTDNPADDPSTDDPADDPTTDDPADEPGTGDPADDEQEDEGTEPDDRGRQARAVGGVDAFDNGRGLRLRRLDGLSGLAGLAPCQSDPCQLQQVSGP